MDHLGLGHRLILQLVKAVVGYRHRTDLAADEWHRHSRGLVGALCRIN